MHGPELQPCGVLGPLEAATLWALFIKNITVKYSNSVQLISLIDFITGNVGRELNQGHCGTLIRYSRFLISIIIPHTKPNSEPNSDIISLVKLLVLLFWLSLETVEAFFIFQGTIKAKYTAYLSDIENTKNERDV